MTELRDEEKWAAAMIAAALGNGARVDQHDDGSQRGMYDLDIAYPDGHVGAVEVTAAADRASIQLWKLVNGSDERWIEPAIRGGWFVSLLPTARAKRLHAELPGLLARLEDAGVPEIRRSGRRQETDPFVVEASELGIVSASQGGTDHTGSIYLTISRDLAQIGGVVDPTGAAVAQWVSAFLAEQQQADVLAKLARSGAEERHVFILLPGFSTAPFGVVHMLMREDESVPAEAPTLPPEVTDVWLVSLWDVGRGLRWSPDRGWERFDREVDA